MATTPEEYDQQERERWVTRDELFKVHSRWATEIGGDPEHVRKVFRFLAYGYDKFVHGSYITAMELFDGGPNKFMLRGHESEDKKTIYKQAVASKLHEALMALCLAANVAGMPALQQEIGRTAQELYDSGELQ